MKQIAWRLGTNADWNTHTTLNACPQLHRFNAGIWLDMEKLTQKWADKYKKVWVICGPVIYRDRHIKYIGDAGEKRIPVPHAFFKIVIRKYKDRLNVLAFLLPT
jgi:endonuclease G, mitochondrial